MKVSTTADEHKRVAHAIEMPRPIRASQTIQLVRHFIW